MFEEIADRTIEMVAKWQAVGFCHGVLNTDNMSILGITIDYGPFGFMEHFDPKYICNHSDNEGRYRYEAQPEMCLFNLERLAESLSPNVDLKKSQDYLQKNYWPKYNAYFNGLMAKKLGLENPDAELFKSLWEIMEMTGSDFTNTFRTLSDINDEDIAS
jgi:uncharacterized protein YdiU (UPF0061 family)